MATMVKDDRPVCTYCGNFISDARQASEDYDGETCSNECAEGLDILREDTWDDEDDEWMFLDASDQQSEDD